MKKLLKRINYIVPDVAVAPFLITMIGVPVAIIAIVAIIITITVVLIKRAKKKRAETSEHQDQPR